MGLSPMPIAPRDRLPKANSSGEIIKMQYTNIHDYDISYQKYIVTSPLICKQDRAKGLKESRPTSRGDKEQDPVVFDAV